MVTAEIRQLYWGIISVCFCQRNMLHVSRATSSNLPSRPHYCWSIVMPNSSSARDIHSERNGCCMVLCQFPDEMLQQSSNASSCMRMGFVMMEHYTVCQHSTFLISVALQNIFFSVSQLASIGIVAPCCMNPTFATPFLSHKTVSISFRAGKVCLNSFGLFGECVFIHCFAARWFQCSKIKLRFNHLLLVRCTWEILHIFVVSL
jgi:hypothetical protein